MILALRAVARVLSFLLLLALALLGLAVAIFSIGAPEDPLGLAKLAEYLRLPELEEEVGGWLAQLEADGPLARWSALAGACALIAGLAIGIALFPRRDRLVVLEESETGTLRARRRALAHVAEALVERERGVTGAKARVRPSRLGRGGKVTVTAARPRRLAAGEVRERAATALGPLASDFNLRPRVRAKLGEGAERVE